MARKNGCPMSAKDWQVDVMSPASSREDVSPEWVRVKGIDSITISIEGDTEDGSTTENVWAEPYVNKRNASLSLEGKPIVDAKTAEWDAGQKILNDYAMLSGCDGDAAVRLTDPYGTQTILDVVVTSVEKSADDTEQTISWDTEVVGEPEDCIYIQCVDVKATGTGITEASSGSTAGTRKYTASVEPYDKISVTVSLLGTGDALCSNQKYSVASKDPQKVKVRNIDGLNFEIFGNALTESGSPVDVVVRSMNNSHTATISVTVAAED